MSGPHHFPPEVETLVTLHFHPRHDSCFAVLLVERFFFHSQNVRICSVSFAVAEVGFGRFFIIEIFVSRLFFDAAAFSTVQMHDETSLSHQSYFVKNRIFHQYARRSPRRLQSPTSHSSLGYRTSSNLRYWSWNLRTSNKLQVRVLLNTTPSVSALLLFRL